MAREDQNLVLGRGRVYVDLLDVNGNTTGEVYIGNTPSLTLSSDEETLEHISSDEGLREVDAEVTLSATRTINFTTDDIQPFNLAMFFRGTEGSLATVAAASVVETITVQRGRWYQLGATEANPSGARLVTLTTAEIGGIAIPDAADNYTLDAALGRIYIKPDAPDIVDDDEIEFDFAVAASARPVVITSNDEKIAAVRFIADNAYGNNIDHYWPKVRLAPDGDYELKSADSWQEITITGKALTKVGYEQHYIDGRAVAA
jgi:hypothetical protein